MGSSRDRKDIFTLSAGSLVAQVIPVLASLVLAHIYTAEEYGGWGVFLSYAGILSIVVMGQYEMAVVRPEKNEDADAVVQLCICAGVLFSAAVALVFFLSGQMGLGYVADIPCKYLLPVYVLGMGLIQVYSHYCNRAERYGVIAVSGIVRNLMQAVSRISMGLAGVTHGLIYGAVAGVLSAVAYGELRMPLRKVFFGRYDWGRIRSVAARYRYFPMFLLPGTLLNAMSTNLPVIIMTEFFAKDYIGYFSMTISLLFLPVQLVGNAMSKIFYKKTSVQGNSDEVVSLSYNLLKISFLMGVLINLVLIPFGEDLFALVLGDTWRTSGSYAVLLCPWILMTLCFSPVSVIFDSRDRQHVEFGLNAVLFILRIFVIWYGSSVLCDMSVTVFLYGLVGFAVWAVEGIIIIRIIGMSFTARQKAVIALCMTLILALWTVKVMYMLG